jgi:hypothetical protein
MASVGLGLVLVCRAHCGTEVASHITMPYKVQAVGAFPYLNARCW